MLHGNQEHQVRAIHRTTMVVSAYVAHNALPLSDLIALIGKVHTALSSLSKDLNTVDTINRINNIPYNLVKNSIAPEALTSFIDGKRYKTLKRHLTCHGFNPHSYRERYGLPPDYPMVAPNYSAQRSELAKAIGLGCRSRMPSEVSADGIQRTSIRLVRSRV